MGADEVIANELQIEEYSKDEVHEPENETGGLFVDGKVS